MRCDWKGSRIGRSVTQTNIDCSYFKISGGLNSTASWVIRPSIHECEAQTVYLNWKVNSNVLMW